MRGMMQFAMVAILKDSLFPDKATNGKGKMDGFESGMQIRNNPGLRTKENESIEKITKSLFPDRDCSLRLM